MSTPWNRPRPQLHDGIPELPVSAESRVERPHVHFSVLSRVRLHAGCARDEPDTFLEVAEQIELGIAAELHLIDPGADALREALDA